MTVGGTPRLDDLDAHITECNGNVASFLDLAVELGRSAPSPGGGRTAELWSMLATIAAADITAARVIEPHLDALAILQQASSDLGRRDATWGVFAAEGGGSRLEASPGDVGPAADGETGGDWRLSGTKPWCSLADRLSDALITAWLPDGGQSLFAVSLRGPGVRVHTDAWHAVGLSEVTSGPIDLTSVAATEVGGRDWYLDRPGFVWGGIGVAACWWGGAVGIARAMTRAAARREPDQLALHHIGAAHIALTAARLALEDAAVAVDAGEADDAVGSRLELRTRSLVADGVEAVLRHTAHALGPAPLALDARHARRVADLSLYVRQHHAKRDEAALGRSILEGGLTW